MGTARKLQRLRSVQGGFPPAIPLCLNRPPLIAALIQGEVLRHAAFIFVNPVQNNRRFLTLCRKRRFHVAVPHILYRPVQNAQRIAARRRTDHRPFGGVAFAGQPNRSLALIVCQL